jgi:hypothetical protein
MPNPNDPSNHPREGEGLRGGSKSTREKEMKDAK